MRRPFGLQLSPSFGVAVLALFFALGGSAFALREAGVKAAPRCPVGTARAIAYVTGNVSGIANLPDTWSSSPDLFGYRYSCSGGTIEVRKAIESGGGFDIRFPGNPGKYPVATPVFPNAYGLSIAPNADGSFHVTEAGNAPGESFPARSDANFVIVLF